MAVTNSSTKYAIFADTHFGSGHTKIETAAHILNLRSQGYRMVFNGDTFDIWRDKECLETYKHILQPGDILIKGNHDWNAEVPEGVLDGGNGLTLRSGNKSFFVTHGDVVDFVYTFALLENTRHKQDKAIWLNLFSRVRPWVTEDVYPFYESMNRMPEWVVKAMEHNSGGFWGKLWAVAALVVLVTAGFYKKPDEVWNDVPTFSSDITDKHPRELAHRIYSFYPEAKDCDYLVMGHLHRPMHSFISGDTRTGYRKELITLGAWVKGSRSTVMLINDGHLEVLEL